jgi:amino acid adenylation domain-containing protein
MPGPPAAAGIARRPDPERAPLSLAQRRIWFFERWTPGTPTYNVPVVLRCHGPLDLEALERSVGDVVRQHEMLRARLEDDGVDPAIVVQRAVVVPFHLIDTASTPGAADGLIEREIRRPFDLAGAPLLRVLVVHTGDEEHRVVVTVHHLVADGWSVELMLRAIGERYSAELAGRPRPSPAPSVRYGDFAVWQRGRLETEALAGPKQRWLSRLEGAPELLLLPGDRPRPSLQSFAGDTRWFELPAPSPQMRALCQQVGVTTFMAHLAAFLVLLQRYTGQDDIVVGTPVAGRTLPELENVIGLMVGLLPLRFDLSGRPTFRDLLGQVRDVVLDALADQDVTFETILSELRPPRDLSHGPLVQVVFGLAPPQHGVRLAGVSVHRQRAASGTAKFDMTWSIEESKEAFGCDVEYSTALFDRSTIERMVGCYRQVVTAAPAEPDLPVASIELLTDSERAALTAPGPSTTDHGPERCLHTLFEEQAARWPNAIALVGEDETLTYRDLNRRAHRLSRALRGLGVGPDVRVGVYSDRGVDAVTAMLAIMKAGGAYLPLEPSYPTERVSLLLQDAGAHLVLTQRELRDRIPAGAWSVMCTDDEGPRREIATEGAADTADPYATSRRDSIAYVIYTSGSSGKPKGVAVTHRNVVRLLEATRDDFRFDEDDVWTWFHSYAFDFSVWEIWGALASGGRLVQVPFWVRRSPDAFYDLLVREGVTVLNQTPTAFRQLEPVDALRRAQLSLRVMVFGGEALDPQSLGRWAERHGAERPRLVNMYGITETTVHVTYRPLATDELKADFRSIGRPISDLRLHVLSPGGRPQPVGVPGELHVSGEGVARGYLGMPSLTAERFVPDPFAPDPGARMYRAGDLARRCDDGTFDYLGRIDDQIKVRGYRIEPGEIEAALAEHRAVRDVVVVGRAVDDGARQLVAYVVLSDGAASAGDLREMLKSRLPEHMVPSAYCFLDALPMTVNGKVDHSALPAPESDRFADDQRHVAPSGAAQEALAAVWSEVLGLGRVSAADDFFELGGDSIRAARLVGVARQRGLHFTLQDLFRLRTIEALASEATVLEAPRPLRRVQAFGLISAADRASLPPEAEDAYPMASLQVGMIYHMRLDPKILPYHNVNSYRIEGPFEPALFDRACQQVVARHPALRTSFDLASYSEPLQLVHAAARIALEVHDLRSLSRTEQGRALGDVMRRERHRLFDLARPPLMRFLLHRLDDEAFMWTFTEHHSILDGWSLYATLSEILERYVTLLDDPCAPEAPPSDVQYREYIALEREAAKSAESLRFWREQLEGWRPIPVSLPAAPATDWDRSVLARSTSWRLLFDGDGAARSMELLLPIDLCEQLVAAAATCGVPLKSVLLAAHLDALGVLTSSRDVVTGLATNGRPEEYEGATDVRGLFLNVVPMRMRLGGGTWMELARSAFNAERESLPHRRYPLARLLSELGVRDLFTTSFHYNHFHVIGEVLGSGRLRVVNEWSASFSSTEEHQYRAEPNSMGLAAGFRRDPQSSRLLLALDHRTDVIDESGIDVVRDLYLRRLIAIAANPASATDRGLQSRGTRS